MREIEFFEDENGNCPTKTFLDKQSDKVFQKIAWVFRIIEEVENIPSKYLKKISSNTKLFEIRIQFSSNIYRFMCFFEKNSLVVTTHGFQKKTQKTPKAEIEKAIKIMKDYYRRKK